MVLKSEGGVAENQGDVLGVYRMVDSYCERPVYKQDGGENYIYYSSASSSWLVGTVVGHEHAWLRNDSEGAPSTRCYKKQIQQEKLTKATQFSHPGGCQTSKLVGSTGLWCAAASTFPTRPHRRMAPSGLRRCQVGIHLN